MKPWESFPKKGKSNPLATAAGFSLMETLVAVMVLATSLVVILQLFSGSLKSVGISEDYTRAVLHAREKMDEILLADALADGIITGAFADGYQWNIRLDYMDPEVYQLPRGTPDMFTITVRITWTMGSRSKSYEVATVAMINRIVPEHETL